MTETLFGTDEEFALETCSQSMAQNDFKSSDISDQLAAYLRKNQIPQRSSKSSRCHLFLVSSLVLSDAALDCHQYSQVLKLAQSLHFINSAQL